MDAAAIVPFVVADAAAWRAWLDTNEESSDGVWLMLAKKGIVHPTSLTYAEALDEALCSGWIDGQKRSYDATTFLQRFTPRRARSTWSQRNLEHIDRLTQESRIRTRGQNEIDRAQADGRWDRAYAGSATIIVPEALERALDASPSARARFDALSRSERFSVLHPLVTAPNDDTLARRLRKAIDRLERGA
ncbi:uncharacterized protein YdeI (YjbR/CyaY-like superfamily) [Microbacterium endophyticum]|uniref:Uncharacterized protein YdeI (YjbR/CyaY-like superfamily) n=1 Tax=Microbacterium endophyticum TaxID=1526412 RepID=A0A7W4YNS8_9MICO|nr:YdeI/OmpD-associated family protein [Microbacterium endophyticum]MBB2976492.1 uncharacterized protein YdeI (YjbR/CyaY-like superfamily) [Microbacterium endophyticum]NIK35938.1 uncharacterized protein YdeI (YjbR/CyaY-like superfamily) [Microbacterium endophyticum]